MYVKQGQCLVNLLAWLLVEKWARLVNAFCYAEGYDKFR